MLELAARIISAIDPRRTDWAPHAVPTTPKEEIPSDQGDAQSRPGNTDTKPKRKKR